MRQLQRKDGDMGLSVLLTAIGVIASWFISRWYYRRSGYDLDAMLSPLAGNHQKLLQATNAVGRMLEQAGIGKPTYDEAGNISGNIVTATAHARGSSQAAAVGRAMYSPVPQYDRQHEQPPAREPEDDRA
jgi:hypothetical protein